MAPQLLWRNHTRKNWRKRPRTMVRATHPDGTTGCSHPGLGHGSPANTVFGIYVADVGEPDRPATVQLSEQDAREVIQALTDWLTARGWTPESILWPWPNA